MNTYKLAGYLVAIGAFVLIVTITLFLTVLGLGPNEDGSVPTFAERGADLVARQVVFKAYWTIEAYALSFMATGGIVLATMLPTEKAAPVGWGLFGVGSLANLSMYGVALGGYFVAGELAAEQPALLDFANEQALAVFFFSNAIAFLGVFFIFLTDFLRADNILPKPLTAIGAVAGILCFMAASAGPFVGSGVMPIAGPAALLGYALLIGMGIRSVRI
ncbi:MAG: hypothetical protein AAFO91_05295 [Bacteroidota bacterium]